MKLLHTSDWHVGKQIRNNSRSGEHRAVLAEIVEIAERESVDLVVVAGDLFETAAPSPESQGIVYHALLSLARNGREVAVIAGNHDNAHALRVLEPLFAECGVRVVSEPTRPDAGGFVSFTAKTGERVNLAMLPFVSKRGIVRAEHLMGDAAFANAQEYTARLQLLIDLLCKGFTPEAVNVLLAHGYVAGGALGGGERPAHMVEEYAITSTSFPATASYVALGHLHRAQRVPGATAICYPGSPLQLDFGETKDRKQVNVVELAPGVPAKVTGVDLTAGRPLAMFKGTVSELKAMVPDDDAWLKFEVNEPQRAGLARELRDHFGERLVEVRITGSASNEPAPSTRVGTPHELFAQFLSSRGVDDPRIASLFAELLDELESGVAG